MLDSAVRARSRGELSTRIHATVDALGNPLGWVLTEGQAADIKQAEALIEGLPTQAVAADRACDADALLARNYFSMLNLVCAHVWLR